MTDENANTADLTMDEKLDRILTKLADVETRLGALETQGTGTTRPLLDQILQEMIQTRDTLTERLDGVEKELRSIDRKFDVFNKEMLGMKADIRDFDERLTELERKPN